MPEEQGLPELARSLHALGAMHGAAAETAHAAVFGPLLDARARAASGLDAALAVFRGQALAARIMSRAAEAARGSEVDAARGRARVARAREALEPLCDALHALDAVTSAHAAGTQAPAPGTTAASAPNAAAWTSQLARVFRVADEACVALSLVLGERDEMPMHRGWLGRFGR